MLTTEQKEARANVLATDFFASGGSADDKLLAAEIAHHVGTLDLGYVCFVGYIIDEQTVIVRLEGSDYVMNYSIEQREV